MSVGWSFISQMNAAIKKNRSILGKRKSFRDFRKDEISNRLSNFDNSNLEVLEDRIEKKSREIDLKRRQSKIKALLIVVLLPLCVGLVVWVAYNDIISHQKELDAIRPFKQKNFTNSEGVSFKEDYYRGGPLASRTELNNGIRHGKSISYYPTGELFRQAEYKEDTLIWERYYFNSGESINDFPRIIDQRTYNLEFTNKNVKMYLRFYDGKIIDITYQELD